MGSLSPETSFSKVDSSMVQELRTILGNSEVLTPESANYADSIKRWSDAVEKKAAVVVYVTSIGDISTVIKYCRKHCIDFAVSGGKHGTNGASSITEGLIIDLAKMRKVTINAKTQTITVEGGAIWKDVDEHAGEYDLATVGGTVNHTGVGGLTLGGGYGWLSGRYGLTIDNLLSCTIILADGKIVAANESKNPDLFWAIRGAGQCFGVAAEFTFQAYPQKNPVWAGQMVFPAEEKLEAVVKFANHLVDVADGDSAMLMGITSVPFLKGLAVIATVFHNGPEEEARRHFDPLIQLCPIMSNTSEIPYYKMNAVMNHAVDHGGRKVSKGASFVTPIQPSFVRSLMEELQHFHQELPETKKTILAFEFFPTAQWCKTSKSAMAFGNRGPHQNVMIGPFWEKEELDQPCRRWAQHVAKQFAGEFQRAKAEGLVRGDVDELGEYANYDGTRANPRKIFGDNLPRLTQLKKLFDPDDIFNKSYPLLAEV